MGNFDFVRDRWPKVWDAASRAESYLRSDPRASATYARRAGEMFTEWIYAAKALPRPYDGSFANLTAQQPFRDAVGANVDGSLRLVRQIGNDAVHKEQEMPLGRARGSLEQLHPICRWLDHCYGDAGAGTPAPFDFALVPPAPATVIRQTRADLERAQVEFEDARRALAEERERNGALKHELQELREAAEAAKAENARANAELGIPDPTLATEAETRRDLIDLHPNEAGWALTDPRAREWPVQGIPSPSGGGKVDYVLWGDNGKPLAVVEAKRTTKSAKEGRLQAEIYADALERDFGQRPLIYFTNGYETWLWDDRRYPPRRVAGYMTKDQLALAIQRRQSLKPLATATIDRTIVERPYQLRAIRAVTEAFEKERRRALLVMATGTGKTRTVIALIDVLQKANWVKRVLFLADRTALVNQAVRAFKSHLPDSAPVNLVTDRDSEGRVFVSTYQTVMGLIDAGQDALRRFGPGYFDMIVVDEAHRSIYNRYGEIFDYFDALVVGLTATPRADVDHNTYRLFELDDGVPTDAFELDDAIAGGYLVPPVARPVDLGFMTRGIRYADLSDAERERWDELEWQDGEIPDAIDAAAMNRWLFNEDTVDKVLEVLVSEGRRVAGGDVLGKTVVFAKNQRHAEFIEERFDANFPEQRGKLARVITYVAGPYAQTLIDDFSTPGKSPHVAISVDMLDTRIDVPDVVNLVFFKPVHSHTKFWQMVGRGTRLRRDLYGPGDDKREFVIFDVCGNIDFFNEELPPASSSRSVSLSERTFLLRARPLAALHGAASPESASLRAGIAGRLQAAVAGMNRDNFLVRKHLRAVERFGSADAWDSSSDDLDAAAELAGLPAANEQDPDEAAKRFDALVLDAQVAVAAGEPVPSAPATRIIAIAQALGDQRSIPAISAQSALLDAIVDPAWWERVDVVMLERVRVNLRTLARLIGRESQAIVYTNFKDTLDPSREVALSRVVPGLNRRAFREKLYGFLANRSDVALHKLRTGRALTEVDLEQLEDVLTSAAGMDAGQLDDEAAGAGGLGRLIRSIVGMDRSAIEEALADFVSTPGFTHRQHAFVDLVVQQLTIAGQLDPRRLYDDPFDGVAPEGPDEIFSDAQITDLIQRLRRSDESAQPRESARA
ncbi:MULTISPECIES: DEAD/DEAH box helicase family protein [unclassified Microbacterium]|uniref:DEAD/DEAH box helicase family protein n=1 Tax=unclassified Microbacterium TaxID=2609290 RepID=UPI00214B8B77|nr:MULTISPECIES: DEAD/DEAH box helicase family protein [unclassified Microbacterium]MCR2784145.1 DEAD/DEAH box helicase family protein [Microbacterium sp. zg.B96]WIM15019.1 DEAD/DEAH box helicase family protein [Microbacterium sp. zg-B96]